jgi:MATE family, multidrug efflux pump
MNDFSPDTAGAANVVLGSRRDHTRIWAIAWPAILANSSAPIVGLVDTWAVGHLPGAVNLAAVGLGSVIFSYIFWAFGFLRMGTTGLVAQAKGRGDTDEIRRAVIRAGLLALMFGAVMIMLQDIVFGLAISAMTPPDGVTGITRDYFEIRIWAAPGTLLLYAVSGVLIGLERVRAMLVLQLILNILNGILNVTFVVGMDMGVPGVALGTLIAQWVASIAGVMVLMRLLGAGELTHWLLARATYHIAAFKKLIVINGFIFFRTILLMTAIAMIMKTAGSMGEAEMAASHVGTQFMLLMALGLDGFAHAAEALAGAAWGQGKRENFRKWVRLTNIQAMGASLIYMALFYFGGNAITAALTDINEIQQIAARIMPMIVVMPLVAVWAYQYDGIFIGATAGAAMFGTMALGFIAYIIGLEYLVPRWGLEGLWLAYLIFQATRGMTQFMWMPKLYARLHN